MARSSLRILGVDPGSRMTGYGVVIQEGPRLIHVESGTLSASPGLSVERRLHRLHELLAERIAVLRPDEVAMEDLFHAVNARSALQLAQVRGVLLQVAAAAGLAVTSYAPRAVKKSVAGSGGADKSQIAWMVPRLLEGLVRVDRPDAGDALAVAICHAHQRALPAGAGGRVAARRTPTGSRGSRAR